jgi:CRP-like cAMP-binding protein
MSRISNYPGTPPMNPLIAKLARGGLLDTDDRARLEEACAKRWSVAARDDIIREGDAPADVNLIMEGFAFRYKLMPGGRRSIMAILIPGDFCDLDVAILKQMDHNIGTFTACSLVEIPRATVRELTDNHPNIARVLRWATLVDEATLREWLANMGQRAADRQLAHFLCELRLRLEMVGMADRHGMHLPLTQEELGDTLGISTVHVNRVLQQLKDQGLLRMHVRNVMIPDLARLESFAEFNPDYLHLIPDAVLPLS